MKVVRPSAMRMRHVTAAADVAGERVGHGQCEADCDGCVDGIAALQHADADVSGDGPMATTMP